MSREFIYSFKHFSTIPKLSDTTFTTQKMEFVIKYFFSKCGRRKLQIWLHLLRKFLMENFIFCSVFLLKCVHFNNQGQSKYIWLNQGTLRRKVFVFGVILVVFGVMLVRIFPQLDWIRGDTRIHSKYGKIRSRIIPNTDTLVTQWHLLLNFIIQYQPKLANIFYLLITLTSIKLC